jgi:hypothetical protein
MMKQTVPSGPAPAPSGNGTADPEPLDAAHTRNGTAVRPTFGIAAEGDLK